MTSRAGSLSSSDIPEHWGIPRTSRLSNHERVGRDDWYRSEVWDETTRDAFEARLARSRTSFHRAQYLKLQGLTLTRTNTRREVEAGEALLERVIAEYPEELHMVAGAHSALADLYVREKRLSKAIEHLRLCLVLESGRSFDHGTRLQLAEALLADHTAAADLGEVAALLDESADQAFFHSERWRIAVSRARLRIRQGDVQGAATHAKEALALLADNTPKVSRHPDVGLIDADGATVAEMQNLAGQTRRRRRWLG